MRAQSMPIAVLLRRHAAKQAIGTPARTHGHFAAVICAVQLFPVFVIYSPTHLRGFEATSQDEKQDINLLWLYRLTTEFLFQCSD